jgi:SAM-dependent methyltransferase
VFLGKKKIYLYECISSGYKFYFPFDIAGKDDLYKQLAAFDWYYIPWKWEHQQSLKYVSRSNSILEVGCGSGSFLKNLRHRFPEKQLTGLEISINQTSENFILNETVQNHSALGGKQYDLVCFFQVLEHIADVSSFLEASIKALKYGGYLIVSVPNNDSILFKRTSNVSLNMPPHHMGLWNKRSLKYLSKQFPLKLIEEYFEPVQDYHFDWFKDVIKEKIRKLKLPLINRLLGNKQIFAIFCKLLRKFYKGHTFIFVYKKV